MKQTETTPETKPKRTSVFRQGNNKNPLRIKDMSKAGEKRRETKPVKTKSARKREENLTPAQRELRNHAKTANDRMRALEKQFVPTSKKQPVKDLRMPKSQALAIANKHLADIGRNRFNEDPKKLTPEQVKSQLYHVKKFLELKSSTVPGLLDIEKNKMAAWADKGVTGDDYRPMMDFMASQTFKHMVGDLDSDQIVDTMNTIKTMKGFDFNNIDFNDLSILTNKQKELINRISQQRTFTEVGFGDEETDEEQIERPLFGGGK